MDIPKNGTFFFDSGIGGLTVLAECRKRLPHEIFYYYGDNARAPYGNLPTETIRSYVFEIFECAAAFSPRAAVLACNTATAVCAEDLRARYSFPIVGAEPAVFLAAKGGGEIFVLTTRATYNSPRFQTLCKRAENAYPHCRLRPVSCDRLAGEIERIVLGGEGDVSSFLPDGTPDSVVLGCTHYVYAKQHAQQKYRVPVYDGNEGIAERLSDLLRNAPRFSSEKTRGDACVFDGIFFLGGAKWSNKTVYEQTFAVKTLKKGC